MEGLTVVDHVAILLALSIPLVIVGGFVNRWVLKKGIGLQFIRCMTVMLALPTVALLAIGQVLPSEAIAALIAGPIGYVLGGKPPIDPDTT